MKMFKKRTDMKQFIAFHAKNIEYRTREWIWHIHENKDDARETIEKE